MYKLQLGDNLFVDIDNGDIFIYKYGDNHFAIKTVKDDYHPPIDEYTIEILSLHSKRHFLFKRWNGAYWWEEIKY